METEDSFNRGRDAEFEALKDRCKSRAKASSNPILIMVIILLLVMVSLIFGLGKKGTDDISFIVFWLVFCCTGGLVILYNFRFAKKIDHLDTPNQLLKSFKKHLRVELISASVLWMFLIADCFVRGNHYSLTESLFAFVLVLFLVIKGIGPWNRRDMEIIEDLQQLVENE